MRAPLRHGLFLAYSLTTESSVLKMDSAWLLVAPVNKNLVKEQMAERSQTIHMLMKVLLWGYRVI